MNLALAGLGNMGQAMARNLLNAGHQVTVYNRTPKPFEGAATAATPADAARQGIVITMVSDDHALEAVAHGPHGILAGLPEAGLHIGMSTTSAALSTRLASAHAERGQHFISAPVFGRPDAAQAAKLVIVVAGDPGQIARAQPLFDAMGPRTVVIGTEPAQANIVKLSGNFMISCAIETMAEVFAVATKAGIERQAIFDLFTTTLFNAPIYKTYGALLLEDKFTPPGFKLSLALKDNRLMLEAAAALYAPMPFASLVRDQFLTALARGKGDLDFSALGTVAQENATGAL